MHKGFLILELTCHLPYVKHTDGEFPEENWLNEAISNTYLPILRCLRRLDKDNVPFKLNLTLSPTLISMLSDSLLMEKYVEFVKKKIEIGKKEIERNKNNPDLLSLAKMYLEQNIENINDFQELYSCNILNGFKEYYKKKYLNIITTFASHCYMPFYAECEKNLEAQIFTAMNVHSSAFNCNPSGLWLPELGYYPGIEKLMKKYQLNYFFTAIHAFLFGSKVPKNGIYAPVDVADSGVYAFCRDLASSAFVLSADEGYPGDFDYRDFSGDISFETPDLTDGAFTYENGTVVASGYKYYANTGTDQDKKIYNPTVAYEKVQSHAENFIYNLKKRVKKLLKYTDRPPVIVCPYDAQVFGHWWYEGIDWLESVIRQLAKEEDLALVLPDEYLYTYKNNESVKLSYSSHGNGGYSGLWLNGDNDWTYKHIHVVIDRMEELAKRFPNESGFKQRALNHAARETLLCQASDWEIMMKNGPSSLYAEMRVREHIHNFMKIYSDLSSNNVDTEWLTKIEKKISAFPDIDYKIFI